MTPSTRLSSKERRTSIIEAVLPLFAKKGFHGATTRELAEAAGVSEALLYRHFPSKEALYEEIQRHCTEEPKSDPSIERLRAMTPGADKLAAATHALMHRIATRTDATFPRLMVTSLVEDGRFARSSLRAMMAPWLELLSESLQAARSDGDAEPGENDPTSELWFCHHLAMALIFLRLPGRPAADYRTSGDELVSRAVRFCLRGLGVKESVINRTEAQAQNK